MGITTLICPCCGSTDLQVRAWVDAQTHIFIEEIGDGEAWCNKCEEIVNPVTASSGRYVVIDDFNGFVNLVVNPEDGMTKVFDTFEEAQREAAECQKGLVINLGK